MNAIDKGLEAVAKLKESAALPFEQARSMPKEVYTSEAFCELEMERIFKRDWVCVGRADQLEKPGDYIAYDLAGQHQHKAKRYRAAKQEKGEDVLKRLHVRRLAYPKRAASPDYTG